MKHKAVQLLIRTWFQDLGWLQVSSSPSASIGPASSRRSSSPPRSARVICQPKPKSWAVQFSLSRSGMTIAGVSAGSFSTPTNLRTPKSPPSFLPIQIACSTSPAAHVLFAISLDGLRWCTSGTLLYSKPPKPPTTTVTSTTGSLSLRCWVSTLLANTCELTLFFSRRVPSGPAESAGRSDPEADHRVLELWLRLRVQPLGCLRLFL